MTTLQRRAERAALLFKEDARAPFVIEFAGLPKAGKTTAISQIQSFLKRCGFKVEVVIERASVCPIRDKRHANFNVWTACTTISQLLEKTQSPPRSDDPDILILDRGIFDSICWQVISSTSCVTTLFVSSQNLGMPAGKFRIRPVPILGWLNPFGHKVFADARPIEVALPSIRRCRNGMGVTTGLFGRLHGP